MYLRARWYDAQNGRFNRLDPFFGNLSDPQSLHKYAYVHGDPIQGIDPTGLFTLGELGVSMGIGGAINAGVGVIVRAVKGRLDEITVASLLYDFVIGALISGAIYTGAWYFGGTAAVGGTAGFGGRATTLIAQLSQRIPSWLTNLSGQTVSFTTRIAGQNIVVRSAGNVLGRTVNGVVQLASNATRLRVHQFIDESIELLYANNGRIIQASDDLIRANNTWAMGVTNSANRVIVLSPKAPLSTLVHELAHFRFLLAKGAWGRAATNLIPQAEARVQVTLRYLGFEVADDVYRAAIRFIQGI